MHNLLFCAHKLCMNYVTNTLLLVSSSVRSKQLLCSVHRQGQKSEQKRITKKFVGFHNHSPLLTMDELTKRRKQSTHKFSSYMYRCVCITVRVCMGRFECIAFGLCLCQVLPLNFNSSFSFFTIDNLHNLNTIMQSVLGGSLHKKNTVIYSWDCSCFSEQVIHCFNANNPPK